MPSRVTVHLTILTLAVFITHLWVTDTILANYSLQLTAVLILVLMVSRHLHKPSQFRVVESVVSTICVLLITTSTGGITSPLFFLNHFLIFELSLLLEPLIPIFLSLVLITIYLFAHQVGENNSLLPLLSFPFLTPLAYFFGKTYLKSKNQSKELRNLSHTVEELKEELVEDELKSKLSLGYFSENNLPTST